MSVISWRGETYLSSNELIGSVCIFVVVLGESGDGERHYGMLGTGNDASMRREIGRHTAQEGDDIGDLHLDRILRDLFVRMY
jgi:hypothetical protein